MSSHERLRRPKLDRTRPIRRFTTLFEEPGTGAGQSGPRADASAESTDGPALSDVVSRSVDLGYRVVDEYVRRGQRAAQRIGERSYGAEAMTSDFQDMAARSLQFVSDFASLWLDLFERAATDSAQRRSEAASSSAAPPQAAGGVRASGMAPAVASATALAPHVEPLRVKIEVTASQPTEVTLDLRPDAIGRRLIVHALRAVDPEKPHVTDVGFRPEPEGQAPTLCIRVPPGHPAGVYSGVIVDEESSRPLGTLSVRVGSDA